MVFKHTPAHILEVPDTFEDTVSGKTYEATQDLDVEDPRGWIEIENACLYVYQGPRGDYEDVPEHEVAQAFDRFWQRTGNAGQALTLTRRWLNIYRPNDEYDISIETIRGYSQSDWAEVFAVVKIGYGTAASHIRDYRMWRYGDVWLVTDSDGESCGGIYADSAEEAVTQYITEGP